jgi:hypothetical protein
MMMVQLTVIGNVHPKNVCMMDTIGILAYVVAGV